MHTAGKTEGIAKNKVMMALFSIIIAGIIVIPMVCGSEEENEDVSSTLPSETGGTVLELMFDNYTPCSPSINFKFELDTQGDSISLKFPGVEKLVRYSGKGTIKVPPRKPGPVEIISLNPAREARVRIWRVIK